MWAVRRVHFYPSDQGIVKILLKAGADVNMTDREGRNAIDYARENTALEATDVLRMLERASPV